MITRENDGWDNGQNSFAATPNALSKKSLTLSLTCTSVLMRLVYQAYLSTLMFSSFRKHSSLA